jgi:hypothetical protein
MAAAVELCEVAPTVRARGRAYLHRARLGLIAGDRNGFERDLLRVTETVSATGDWACQARADQLRAVVTMACGDWAKAELLIESSAARLAAWPVEQEIALVQRWWHGLDGDTDEVKAMADLATSFDMHPANHLLVAYTYVRLGEIDLARQQLELAWPDKGFLVPIDTTYQVGLVGALQVAAALGDHDRLREAIRLLRPYDGQLVLAGDGFFTPGSVARFLDFGEQALVSGTTPDARTPVLGAQARALELAVGGEAFVEVCDERMLASVN